MALASTDPGSGRHGSRRAPAPQTEHAQRLRPQRQTCTPRPSTGQVCRGIAPHGPRVPRGRPDRRPDSWRGERSRADTASRTRPRKGVTFWPLRAQGRAPKTITQTQEDDDRVVPPGEASSSGRRVLTGRHRGRGGRCLSGVPELSVGCRNGLTDSSHRGTTPGPLRPLACVSSTAKTASFVVIRATKIGKFSMAPTRPLRLRGLASPTP